MKKINILEHNARAWDEESIEESEWCTPVDSETIRRAKVGDIALKLTPKKYVPKSWLEGIAGKDVLCLGSGGGQQAPILAAAGANVTSLDISAEQLAKDELVARRDGLTLRTIKGDMSDLSVFEDESFDLVVNAVSNTFIPDLKKAWNECYRVLRPGGELIAAFMNPSFFLFNHKRAQETGALTVEYRLPYSDLLSLGETRLREIIDDQVPLVFSHSLEEQIGGQTEAGFIVTGLYEDWWSDEATPLNRFSPTTIVTRAVKKTV